MAVDTRAAYLEVPAGLLNADSTAWDAPHVSDWALAIGLLGDLNGDGNVNGLDVDPFVDVLLGGLFHVAADMNVDGAVNGLDVAPFVAAVIAGGAQTVPEPSTLCLATIAPLGLLCWRRAGRCEAVSDVRCTNGWQRLPEPVQ